MITHVIRDGEYEYVLQTPRSAKTEKQAIASVLKEDKEWVKNDYRIVEIGNVAHVTENEYAVLSKYIS